ncbi:MAG TPA: hypothetical protein VI504_17280 [Candidatus Eisenbacteria bacterium]
MDDSVRVLDFTQVIVAIPLPISILRSARGHDSARGRAQALLLRGTVGDWRAPLAKVALPTWQSVGLVIGGLGALAIAEAILRTLGILGEIGGISRDLVIAASAACLSVGIALAILVSESLRDSSPLGRAGALLRGSWVLPILCGTVASVALAMMGAYTTAIGVGVEVAICGASVASLYRLVGLMLDPVKMSEARNSLERDLLAAAARLTVEDRVADNVVAHELEADVGVVRVLGPSWIPARARGVAFNSEGSGFVADVRISALHRICAILRGALARAQKAEAQTVDSTKGSIAALTIRIGEWIEAGAPVLSVSSVLRLTPSELGTLTRLCSQLCVRRSSPTRGQTLNLLIVDIESDLGRAIIEGDFQKTLRLCETMRKLVEGHLQCIVAIGATFGHREARGELGSLGRQLQIAREVPETVERLIARAVRGGDTDIAREVTTLPTVFVRMAMRAGDLLVLESFVGVHATLSEIYFDGEGVSVSIRRMLWDRSWRHLRETGEFVWGTLLEGASSSEYVERLSEAAREIAKAFQELLKTCIDHGALGEFQDALTALGRIVPRRELEDLEHRALLAGGADSSEAAPDEPGDPVLRAKDAAYKDVLRVHTQVLLGLMAWLDRSTTGQPDEPRSTMRLRLLGALPREFNVILDAYADAVSRDRSESMGWERWVLAGMPEGVASFVSMDLGIARAFVDASLSSDLSINDRELAKLGIEVSVLFRPGSEVDAAIEGRIPDAGDNSSGAQSLRQSIDRLRAVSVRIRSAGEQRQMAQEQAANIEESMVLAFVAGVRRGYVDGGIMRVVLGGDGGVETKALGPTDSVMRVRVAQRTFKGLFSRADLEAVYVDEPERWGANLARVVDEHLFKELVGELMATEREVTRDDVEEVGRAIDELAAGGCSSVSVVTTAVTRVSAMMWHLPEFRRSARAGLREGTLVTAAGTEARIYSLYGAKERDRTVILCSGGGAGVWESAWTAECEQERWRVGNPLRVRVTDLWRDEGFRRRIVEGAEGTAAEKQKLDEELSREATVEIEVAVGRTPDRPVVGCLLRHRGPE